MAKKKTASLLPFCTYRHHSDSASCVRYEIRVGYKRRIASVAVDARVKINCDSEKKQPGDTNSE